MARPRVVIVGAGFAGLNCARELAGGPVDVVLIDRHNYHTFQPLLYQVATSGLDASDVAYPARAALWKVRNVSFRVADIVDIEWEAREIITSDGARISYDYLVIASGATANYFGVDGAQRNSFPLYTLDDARRLRNHILTCFEEAETEVATHSPPPPGRLTFVVVGGGPTGVEVAGALVELVDTALVHDFPGMDPSMVSVVLVETGPSVLSPFNAKSRAFAAAELARRRVAVRVGQTVARVGETEVRLSSGEVIATRTVIWAAGVKAAPITAEDSFGAARSVRGGRIEVGSDLQVAGHPGVFAVGDVAGVPAPGEGSDGALCPQVAQVAIQSGRHCAGQILALVRGGETQPFAYRDKGIMATIGRRAAVAEVAGRMTLIGTIGWLAWLGLHLVYLIGFRNRVVVLVNWAWRYLSWRSGPRVILDRQ